jgi:hypothetical protein
MLRVVAAGIIRTVYLSRIQSSEIDKTWLGFNVCAAGIAESKLGIICACAPSIRKYFLRFFDTSSTDSREPSIVEGGVDEEDRSPQNSERSKVYVLSRFF